MKNLKKLVTDDLRRVTHFAAENERESVTMLVSCSMREQKRALAEMQRELENSQNRYDELDNITLTDKRMKSLTEKLVNELAGKALLTVEEQDGLLGTKLCHVDNSVLATDMAAIKNLNDAISPEQFMLAILLLKSGVAKKLLDREQLSQLKKAASQDKGDFQPYVKNMIAMTEAMISSSIAVFMVTQ